MTMTLMVAEDELRVGIGAVDADHRMLDQALADLRAAVANYASPARIGALLRVLEERTLSHFAMEEGMMAATRYPGLARHRISHQRVIEQAREIIARFGQGGPMPGCNQDQHWVRLLSELLISHVKRDDMHFGRWLKALGKR